MLIKGVTLKEKNIVVNSFMPTDKMPMKLDRVNSMPPEVNPETDFNCILEYNVKIQDEKGSVLVKIKIAYLILAKLDTNETYEQQKIADKLFNTLEPMYLKTINDLLRETSFPALPLNLQI